MKRSVVRALLVVALLAVAARGQDARVAALVAQVDQGSYTVFQHAIEDMGLGLYGGSAYDQGYRGRDGGDGNPTLGNLEARLYLADQFAAMGLNVTIQGPHGNVVAEWPGAVQPGRVWVLSGHYDSQRFVPSPGGDDNASGTAGVLEAARVLSGARFGATLRFVCFNDEEHGMTGSTDYVQTVVLPGGQDVAGAVNLDMILRPAWDDPNQRVGIDPSQPIDADVMAAPLPVCTDLAGRFLAAAATYVPALVFDDRCPRDDWLWSDHQPFTEAGYPAIWVAENSLTELQRANRYYHHSLDASSGLAGYLYDYAFATDVTRAAVAFLAAEAGPVPEPAMLALLGAGAVSVAGRRRCAGGGLRLPGRRTGDR